MPVSTIAKRNRLATLLIMLDEHKWINLLSHYNYLLHYVWCNSIPRCWDLNFARIVKRLGQQCYFFSNILQNNQWGKLRYTYRFLGKKQNDLLISLSKGNLHKNVLKIVQIFQNFCMLFRYFAEKKIYRLHVERIVNHFLNPLTRNIDFQDIRIR